MNNLEEKLALSMEVLSALPKNNIENIKHYITEGNKIYAEYQTIKIAIVEEMKQRIKNFENSIKSDPLPSIDYQELDYHLKITNPLNTPYEKLDLDEIFYELDNFSKSNFEKVNEYIIRLITIYNRVGLNLTSDDFFYNEYENAYMKAILNAKKDEKLNSNLKPVFEEYYWKNPDIIKDIATSFKSLYHHNIKKFNNHITNLQLKVNKSYDQIIKEYQSNIIENNLLYNSNKEYLVKKFTKNEFNIMEYLPEGIEKLSTDLIKGDILKYSRTIYNFNDTLKEYQSYLKIKNIIDKVKDVLIKSDTKNSKKIKAEINKTIKEIFKIEKKLKMAFKKKLDKKELIVQIANLYKEYDNLYYEEAILTNINKESKIIDVIFFLLSYYSYFLGLLNETKEEDDKSTINYDEIKNICLNPHVNLINNLGLLKEYNMEMIILDKYKLDNLNLESLALDEDTLQGLIDKTNKLCNYYNITSIKDLEIDKIYKYIKLRNTLNYIE